MQTMLRIPVLVIVASLLWISPTSAESQRAVVSGKVMVTGKAKVQRVSYIGTASWYGEQHQGRKMANGQKFDRQKLTAASWYFPLGTRLRVVNVKNGESVEVTVTDRGPNLRLNRILDLSEAAAQRLGYRDEGLTKVFLYPLGTFETKAAQLDATLAGPSAEKASGELEAMVSAAPK